MRIQKNKSIFRKRIIAIIATILLVTLGIFALVAAVNQSTSPDSTQEYENKDTPPSGNKSPDTGANPGSSSPASDTAKTQPDPQPAAPEAPTSTDSSTKSKADVAITASNQTSEIVQIRTLISRITSQGKCTLTLTKGEVSVQKTTDVQPLPNASTCRGFDIPTSELASGTWYATLLYESDSHIGETTSTIEVQ